MIHARSARGVHGGEADFAPARVEQVRSVRRAGEPELERLDGADVRRAPEEVLADGPASEAARGIEVREPLGERSAVGGAVAEVALLRHRGRVSGGGGGQRRRQPQACKPPAHAQHVHLVDERGLQLPGRGDRSARIGRARSRRNEHDERRGECGDACPRTHTRTIGSNAETLSRLPEL